MLTISVISYCFYLFKNFNFNISFCLTDIKKLSLKLKVIFMLYNFLKDQGQKEKFCPKIKLEKKGGLKKSCRKGIM